MKLKKVLKPLIFLGSTVAFAVLFLPKITKKKAAEKKGEEETSEVEATAE